MRNKEEFLKSTCEGLLCERCPLYVFNNGKFVHLCSYIINHADKTFNENINNAMDLKPDFFNIELIDEATEFCCEIGGILKED